MNTPWRDLPSPEPTLTNGPASTTGSRQTFLFPHAGPYPMWWTSTEPPRASEARRPPWDQQVEEPFWTVNFIPESVLKGGGT